MRVVVMERCLLRVEIIKIVKGIVVGQISGRVDRRGEGASAYRTLTLRFTLHFIQTARVKKMITSGLCDITVNSTQCAETNGTI
jgi:hypothetical protein